MKISHKHCILPLVLIFMISCNHSDNNTAKASAPDTSNVNRQQIIQNNTVLTDSADDCSYFVERNEADLMINKYNSDFHKTAIKKQFWIELCILKSVKSFLDNNPSYDGVRFFLTKTNNALAKSGFMIVPTTPAQTPTAYEKHNNAFGVTIPLLAGCQPSELEINTPVTPAIDKINLFGKKFRGESIEGQRNTATIDQLSLGIWMSECKINKIMSLYTPANNLDGLMAISAAYYQDDERRRRGERKHIVQTTFLFVPTKNKIPDWSVVPPPPPAWVKDAGFNHGALCPQICN